MRRPHGGHPAPGVLDFSVSLNPLGPPDSLNLLCSSDHLARYPEPCSATLQQALAEHHGVDPEFVLVTNGACEAIELVMASLRPRRVVVLVPAFTEYEDSARAWGHQVVTIAAREETGFHWDFSRLDVQPDDLVVLGNPANPAGVVSELPDLDATLLVDETFLDFVDERSVTNALSSSVGNALCGIPRPTHVAQPPSAGSWTATATHAAGGPLTAEGGCPTFTPAHRANAVPTGNGTEVVPYRTIGASAIGRPRTLVIRSFTKIFACPGLRLGYIVGGVEPLRQRQPAWSVSRLAQVAGEAMLRETAYLEFTRRFVRECRDELVTGLKKILGVTVFPSAANFILLRVPQAGERARRLLDRGIEVRLCDSFTGLAPDQYIRVAVRKRSENQRLLEALDATR